MNKEELIETYNAQHESLFDFMYSHIESRDKEIERLKARVKELEEDRLS